MPFLTQGVFILSRNNTRYKLRNILEYYSEMYAGTLSVPAGFSTDFASIPRVLRSLVPQHPRQAEPACLHDYLYSRNTKYKHITRKVADQIFKEALKSNGVGRRRHLMYIGVRLGGWAAFRKK